MPINHVETRVRHRPGVAIVDIHGDIDGFAEEALNGAYAEAESQDPPAILLNLAGVHYINSTGIALVVGLLAKARRSGRRLMVCGLSEHYLHIFQVTRLADHIDVFPDEVSAMADLSEAAA